jgi:hypothetical protein
VRAETLPSGEQRFLLLETIREFALEQLRAHGEEALLRERHYATYLHLFRMADGHLRGPAAAIWFARLQPEQDNLRAALQWTLAAARYADATWLMIATNYFRFLCGNYYEGARWFAQLLPHRQALAVDLRLAILLSFYGSAFHLEMEEFQPLARYLVEVMELLAVCSHKLLHSWAWFWTAVSTADFLQAVEAWERCIGLARQAAASPGPGEEFCGFADRSYILSLALFRYAERLMDRGELARAELLAAESLALFRTRGDRYGIGDGLGMLGLLALLQGDLAQAHMHFHEVVTFATAFRYHIMLCEWQPLLGLVTLYGGDTPEARRLLSESLRLCLEIKHTFLLARNYTYLAETALWAGELDQAAQWLAQSLAAYADPHRIRIYQVERLLVAARLATAQQQYRHAATLFGLADQVSRHIHYAPAGPLRTLVDAALATVRGALDPAVFAEAFATGQQLSLDEAFAGILLGDWPYLVDGH